jgi:hypothetical protein
MTAFGETTCGGRGGDGATLQSRVASNLICNPLLARVFYFYFTPNYETAWSMLFPAITGKGASMAKITRSIPESSDLLPDPLVAKRYRVTTRTIYRWDRQSDLDFPPPISINGRKYRRVNQLEQWERRHVAEKVG